MTTNPALKPDDDSQSPHWKLDYDNDTGPGDESFFEWWTVTGCNRSFKCDTKADAEWLLKTLNPITPESKSAEVLRHDDGGPAFPVSLPDPESLLAMDPVMIDKFASLCSGMTLRNWFAGQALAGIVAEPDLISTTQACAFRAKQAYALADAMIEARKARPMRDRIKALWPVMEAFRAGKTIQVRDPSSGRHGTEWTDTDEPTWSCDYEYRVKPEPREWWLAVRQTGVVAVFETEAKAIAEANHVECVHVREVL